MSTIDDRPLTDGEIRTGMLIMFRRGTDRLGGDNYPERIGRITGPLMPWSASPPDMWRVYLYPTNRAEARHGVVLGAARWACAVRGGSAAAALAEVRRRQSERRAERRLAA
jgi:hypothetical protein